MHLRLLLRHGIGGLLPCRYEVARDDRPVPLSPKRYVTRYMAGRVKPTPARHLRDAAIIRQRVKPTAHIHGATWIER